MRLQDLVTVAAKIRVVTRFRDTVGLAGRLSTRLQPNHPTDDPKGIAASDHRWAAVWQRRRGDRHQSGVRQRRDGRNAAAHARPPARGATQIPTQSCVLAHVTTQMEAMRARRAGRPGVSIHRRHRSRQRGVRRQYRDARRGARAGARTAARHGRRQRHVLRDRARQRAVCQRASWRRSADSGSSRLRGWRGTSTRCW